MAQIAGTITFTADQVTTTTCLGHLSGSYAGQHVLASDTPVRTIRQFIDRWADGTHLRRRSMKPISCGADCLSLRKLLLSRTEAAMHCYRRPHLLRIGLRGRPQARRKFHNSRIVYRYRGAPRPRYAFNTSIFMFRTPVFRTHPLIECPYGLQT